MGKFHNSRILMKETNDTWEQGEFSKKILRKRELKVDFAFQVIHPEKSENWTLQIKYAQFRDAGKYECQINSNPKKSKTFELSVIGKTLSQFLHYIDYTEMPLQKRKLSSKVLNTWNPVVPLIWRVPSIKPLCQV